MEITINRNIQDDSGVDAKLFNKIMGTFEWALGKIPGQKTGRLIVEMQADNADTPPHSVLDISPAAGEGKNCAEGKLGTLRKYPCIANTAEVLMLPDNVREDDDVAWYGGIQATYADTDLTTNEVAKGIVRVAFSGAKEWHDVFVAVAVLDTAINYVADACPDHHISYDLEKLREDPVSGFFCKLFNV